MKRQTAEWSVSGISPEARERARTAAQREGKSLGDWLHERIIEEASRYPASWETRQETPPHVAGLSNEDRTAHPRIDSAIQALEQLMETNRRTQEFASRAMNSVASELSVVARDHEATFQALNERIDRVAQDADTSHLGHTVEELTHGLSQLAQRGAHEAMKSAGQIEALAGNVESLGKKVMTSRDDQNRLGLFMQEQLSTFAERVRAAETRSEAYAKIESAVATLSARMADFKRMEDAIAALVSDGGKTAADVGAIRDSVGKLGRDLTVCREQTSVIGARAEEQISALAARMRAAEAGLSSIPKIEETVRTLETRGSEFSKQAAELRGDVDGLGAALAASRQETNSLGARMDDYASTIVGRMAAAENRIADIAQIEQHLQSVDARIGANREDTNQLSIRMDEKVSTFAVRIRNAEDQIASISQIEQAIQTLQSDIGASRDETRQFLDQASQNFAAVLERLSAAEQSLAALSEIEGPVGALAASHSETAGRIEAFATHLDALTGELTAARTEPTNFASDVQKTFALMAERMAAMEVRFAGFDKLETLISKLGERDQEMAAANTEIAGKIGALDRAIAAVKDDSGRAGHILEEELNEVAARMDAIEARSAGSNLDDRFAEIHERLTAAEGQTANAENKRLASFERKMQDIVSRLAGNEQQTNDIKTGLGEIAQRIEQRLAASEQAHGQVLAAVHAKLGEMTDRLGGIEAHKHIVAVAAPVPAVVSVPLAEAPPAPEAAVELPPILETNAVPPMPASSFEVPFEPEVDANLDVPPVVAEAESQAAEIPEPPFASDLVPGASEPEPPVGDYLAQARRAAQAAADPSKSKAGANGAEKNGEPRKFRFVSTPVAIGVLSLTVAAGGMMLVPRLFSHAPQTAPHNAQTDAKAANAQIVVAPPNAPAAPSSPLDQIKTRAAAGDSKAMLMLAIAYAKGTGVEADETQAVDWLTRSATANDAVAQYMLGMRYERGLGVAKNLDQAAHWYGEGAKLGNRKAMYNLAVAYANGAGIAKDPRLAARWFRTAADLGLTDSQFNLGVLYGAGVGVDASLVEAYKWFAIAAASGDAESKMRVEALASQIMPEEKNAADMAVANFKPQAMKPEANDTPAVDLPAAPKAP